MQVSQAPETPVGLVSIPRAVGSHSHGVFHVRRGEAVTSAFLSHFLAALWTASCGED